MKQRKCSSVTIQQQTNINTEPRRRCQGSTSVERTRRGDVCAFNRAGGNTGVCIQRCAMCFLHNVKCCDPRGCGRSAVFHFTLNAEFHKSSESSQRFVVFISRASSLRGHSTSETFDTLSAD